MIKMCKIEKEKYEHIIDAHNKKTRTQRFNKLLTSKNTSLYDVLDNFKDVRKCNFCGRTAAIKNYDIIMKDGYMYIDNLEYNTELYFCSSRTDVKKDDCKGKRLNNNSKEFVKFAYNLKTIEEAHEYLLKRNKSQFYKHNHASEEDYTKYQTRNKEWYDSNNKDWNEYCKRQAYTNTVDYFIEKYGEQEGVEFYNNLNKQKDSSSLKHHIEKYGEELGKEKFEDKCTRCESNSIKYFVRKYGEQEGTVKYNYIRSIEGYIEKYGEFKGRLFYNRRYSENETTQASKESLINVFNYLCENVDTLYSDLLYFVGAFGKKEYTIIQNNKRYFYDFAIPEIKLVVEYHGSRYHYNENYNYENIKLYKTLEEMKEYDINKRLFTEKLGYTYIEVFDTDNFEEKINIVLNTIKEKIKEKDETRDVG